ncbi:MAG: glycoside hydrolase family 3 C-terminal domain-containing protein, partial [Clostridiales bacterium]|nr:glycoside hydrolase family 3 C-terminal domain-containing protein [Clostridiales bacterium]
MSNESRQLVRRMTLEEKASMVSGGDFWHTDAVERLAIPAAMVSDGPHGLRKQADEADHLGVNESIQAVCFPTASGTASSFDRNLLARLGETLGEECQAEGVSILLGPAVNIKRSPLCGRNFEYFSEDPYLAGELAQRYINGVQSKHVGTSIKHFAVNSQEKRRMSVSAVLDERTLREIYLPAFEIAVRKAQPWTVMCSYNKVNGCFASEHDYLLNQILRHEWDFQGYVMSDWGACDDRVKGIPSGLDLEMPSSGDNNTKKILAAVHSGKLEESALDTACERILEKVQYFYDHWDKNAKFDRAADHEKARDAAVQSMVLLKNNGVLPLSKDQNIAFIGEFAKTPRYQGGGSSHINSYKVTGALEAAEDYAQVRYAKGFPMDKDAVNEADFAEAVKLAQESDVAVVFAGLPDNMESEGFDRQHLNLPQCQTQLIERIAQVQKNLVVVLHNGSPVLLPWIDQACAVLESYLGGEAVGEAQCMLLFGEANP